MSLFSYLACGIYKIDPIGIPKSHAGLLLTRGIFGFFAFTSLFMSIHLLPFSLAMVISFTQPVAAAIIGWAFGGEKLRFLEWAALISAMIGVVILTNPTFIFFWIENDRGFNIEDYPYFI